MMFSNSVRQSGKLGSLSITVSENRDTLEAFLTVSATPETWEAFLTVSDSQDTWESFITG